MLRSSSFLLLFIWLYGRRVNSLHSQKTEYREQLDIEYLSKDSVFTNLSFSMTGPLREQQDTPFRSLGSFPHLIHSSIRDLDIAKGRLSFARGRWNEALWGAPPFDTTSAGFQLHLWLKNAPETQLSQNFNDFIAEWSADSCASLKKLTWRQIVTPLDDHGRYSRTSIVASNSSAYTQVFGMLPHEPLCTENLNVWLKTLLPCGQQAGLASLLTSESVYRSEFHMIDLEFEEQCVDSLCAATAASFTLSIRTLYDLTRWDRKGAWTLKDLFGAELKDGCALNSNQSLVKVKLPASEASRLLSPPSRALEHGSWIVAEYGMKNLIGKGSLGAQSLECSKFTPEPSAVHAFRFKVGVGNDSGAFGISVENRGKEAVRVRMLEVIPWYFRFYLHAAEFYLDGQRQTDAIFIDDFKYEPAMRRGRPARLESHWTVQPGSRAHIVIPFDREFLRSDDFPSDWERGLELPGAVVEIVSHPNTEQDTHRSLTTNVLLFSWPIPDNTMPFNAILLSATLVALFYGAFFNMSFRKWYLRISGDPPAAPLLYMLWKVKEKLKSLKRRPEQ